MGADGAAQGGEGGGCQCGGPGHSIPSMLTESRMSHALPRTSTVGPAEGERG